MGRSPGKVPGTLGRLQMRDVCEQLSISDVPRRAGRTSETTVNSRVTLLQRVAARRADLHDGFAPASSSASHFLKNCGTSAVSIPATIPTMSPTVNAFQIVVKRRR